MEEIEDFTKSGLNGRSFGNNWQEVWNKAFSSCFAKVDAEVGGVSIGACGLQSVAPETVGSTAVVAIVCRTHIIVANCGDSRAVLYRGKEPMALSVDHKVRQHFFSFNSVSRMIKIVAKVFQGTDPLFHCSIYSQTEKMNMTG